MSQRIEKGIGVLTGGAFLFFGVCTFDLHSARLGLIGLLFAGPLVCFRLGWRRAQFVLSWLCVLLIGQVAVIRIFPRKYFTLAPATHIEVDVKPGVLPGISGVHRITTDELGFRHSGRIDYADARPFRIFAIGGSTTEGIYLDDAQTWPHLLQETLRRSWNLPVEVVNTGVSGLRAENHLATLEQVLKLHPDLITIMVGINDWNQAIHARFALRPSLFARLRQIRSRFMLFDSPLGHWLQSAHEALVSRRDDGDYFATQRDSLSRAVRYDWMPAEVAPAYARALAAIGDLCHRSGAPCVFIDQVTGYRPEAGPAMRQLFWMTPPNTAYTLGFDSLAHLARLYNDHLRAFAAAGDHPFCGIAERIPPSPAFLYDDCHFNPGGAAEAAALIGECLRDWREGGTRVSVRN